MVKRSKGTLSTYTRKVKSKGKVGMTGIFKEFNTNDKIVIDLKAGFSGMPHPRYRGKHGVIVNKQGNAYVIEIKDGDKKKTLISYPVHLKRI